MDSIETQIYGVLCRSVHGYIVQYRNQCQHLHLQYIAARVALAVAINGHQTVSVRKRPYGQ